MNIPTETILLVDDQPQNLAVLSDLLEPAGYKLVVATNAEQAIRLATKARPDLILLDVIMPNIDGIETCRRLKNDDKTREIPVIFITGRTEIEVRVEGFRAGGVDYVVKPFEADEVLARVRTHLSLARTKQELVSKNHELSTHVDQLQAEIARRRVAEQARHVADERLSVLTAQEARRWNVAGLVGRSRALAALLHEVERLQTFGRVGVLLTGESGTGKELVARALHSGSPRAAEPFIPVNCVAVPTELMESMFFGHIRGAFTGATSDRKGIFELANGGTLFLDEIGDMPAALQGKLLRVLEDGRVQAVGSTTDKQVDVRIIAATNANLESKISSGAFRQDLYFRLARTTVHIPPLRERKEDVPLLAAHFIKHFSVEIGFAPPSISDDALTALRLYDFPGNVRELRNLIESALIASGGAQIFPKHLWLPKPETSTLPTQPVISKQGPDLAEDSALPLNLEAAEHALIRRALSRSNGNVAEAARLLGVHRSRIYRVIGEATADAVSH